MRVFVTGATGFIGSAVVPELHRRPATRSSASPARTRPRRRSPTPAPQVHRGSSTTSTACARPPRTPTASSTSRSSTTSADFAAAGRRRPAAVETIGAALEGSDRPLVITSGHRARSLRAAWRPRTTRPTPTRRPRHRARVRDGDARARPGAACARRSCALPPSVHGEGDHGFVPMLIGIAREQGVSAYVGDGDQPLARGAPARRRARCSGSRSRARPAGSVLHAVGEEGVPTREIAEAIGRGLGVPVASVAPEDAGEPLRLARRLLLARRARLERARRRSCSGWEPSTPALLEDLAAGHYFGVVGTMRG